MELFWHVVIAFLLINELNCARLPWSQDVILQNENKPWDGNEYWYKFKTLFGISRSEKGTLKKSDNGKPYIDVVGQITYPIAGYVKNIHYKADDKGFDILNMSIQRDTNKNTPNIEPRTQQVDGGDGDKIQFPVENGVIDTDNTTVIPEDGEVDDRFGNVPPAVLATLLGG